MLSRKFAAKAMRRRVYLRLPPAWSRVGGKTYARTSTVQPANLATPSRLSASQLSEMYISSSSETTSTSQQCASQTAASRKSARQSSGSQECAGQPAGSHTADSQPNASQLTRVDMKVWWESRAHRVSPSPTPLEPVNTSII